MEKNRRAGNFLWTTRFHVLIGIIAGNMRKKSPRKQLPVTARQIIVKNFVRGLRTEKQI